MSKVIRVNQQWRTRDGSIVRVTCDKGADAEDGWRWGLSNGFVAHEDDGRVVFFEGKQGPSDLMEEVGEQALPTQKQMEGMDWTMGHEQHS